MSVQVAQDPGQRLSFRVGAATIVALATLAGACGDGDEIPSYSTLDSTIEVEVSNRFSIDVGENPSLGDAWQLRREPDPDVLKLVEDEWETYAEDPEIVGAGGTRTFTFEAVGPGETKIVLFNCFRCDDGKPRPPPEGIEISGPYSWDVVVE